MSRAAQSVDAAGHLHLRYIDCARGYAVLMVIACHLTKDYPGLPWPVRRLMMSGWYGVQLFFLASCLTLLMSWHAERERRGSVDLRAFFLRRFFRIAPAYYLAGVLYFIIDPPQGGFDAWQALRSAAFVNAWQPHWTSVARDWIVVPGGWSIGVEFTFYAVFPLFALRVTCLGRAALVFAACIAAGAAANLWGAHHFADLTALQRSNFLYFWFPNQACVFALGGVLYFLLRDLGAWRAVLARHATGLGCACILAFCALCTVPLGHFIGDGPGLPGFLAACPLLFGFLVALSSGGLFVNRAAASWAASASAPTCFISRCCRLSPPSRHLPHAAPPATPPSPPPRRPGRRRSPLTLGASYGSSYRAVELPMMTLGKG